MADLTPFGFTATESRVYGALLELGPATGYAVARTTRLARANAYGALDGLVVRGAASRMPGPPVRYRATDPDALVAELATRHGEALERLSDALAHGGRSGDPETHTVTGLRALTTLIVHVVARAEREIEGVLTTELIRQTLPAWRRAAERATLRVRIAGGPPPEATSLGLETAEPGSASVLLVDDRQTIVVADGASAPIQALWSSHPAVATLARAAISCR
jgi:HTH-type transcriptional regulator, sugar sensing transcriptional regulator